MKKRVSVAEYKILAVFISFVVFGVYTMGHYSVFTAKIDEVFNGLNEYFLCESTGHIPGKCNRGKFERHLYPHMSALAYVFMGFIPLTILNFVVQWKKLEKFICLKKSSVRDMSLSRSRTSSTATLIRMTSVRVSQINKPSL